MRKRFVYHASPENGIHIFRPTGRYKGQQSIPMNEGGIYVAPTFKDAVAWAATYVSYKKGKNVDKEFQSVKYRNITIYKISVPKHILDSSWSNSSWEKEYFISGKYVNLLEVASKETYNVYEIKKMYERYIYRQSSIMCDKYTVRHANNLASKYYLQLKEKLNKMVLSGYVIDTIKINPFFSRLSAIATGSTAEKDELEWLVEKINDVIDNTSKRK